MLTDDVKAIVALTTRLDSPGRSSLNAQGRHFHRAVLDAGHEPASVFALKGSIANLPGVEEPERIEVLLSDA